VREQYASVVPAAGSVVDLLVRAKNKQTGQPLKAHQIVAQVRGRCAARAASMWQSYMAGGCQFHSTLLLLNAVQYAC
jgi:hypothetical protein